MAQICPLCNKRPATLHITDLPHPDDANADPTFLDICETCARERNILPTADFSLKDILQSAVQKIFEQQSEQAGEDEDDDTPQLTFEIQEIGPSGPGTKQCPECGISFREIRQRGRFGCPHDYQFFRDDLEPLMQQVHHAKAHTGKMPPRYDSVLEGEARREELERELDDAVTLEDFERAAKLRDEIQALETTTRRGPTERPAPFRFPHETA